MAVASPNFGIYPVGCTLEGKLGPTIEYRNLSISDKRTMHQYLFEGNK